MGFAAAAAVPDGVAIAADSRLRASFRHGPPATMSDTQQKIVRLSDFVAAVIPEPHFLTEDVALNVRSGLQHVSSDIHPTAKLEELQGELPGRFCSAAGVSREQITGMPIKLVGYNDTDRAVKTVVADGFVDFDEKHSTTQHGLDWFGDADIATRLVKGNSALSVEGVPAGPVMEYFIPTALMSLADAVDLAETLVDTTATFAKFVQAVIPPNQEPEPLQINVGGQVQSAVVRSTGFSWVTRPGWVEGRPDIRPNGPPFQG